MSADVLDLRDIDETLVAAVGGKAARLGELSRIDDVRVPPGFCVTTNPFRRVTQDAPEIVERIARLSLLHPDDRDAIRTLGAEIRRALEVVAIPEDLATSIARSVARLGDQTACAVRSSATHEDSQTASFAGQYDTYLNVIGIEAILHSVRLCWASLFSDRAVTYRQTNGFDHGQARIAVVVQQMVFAQAAGTLFTADPVTSDRTITSVEACIGLGEALVSGRVNGDAYKVRGGEIVEREVAVKRFAIYASPSGGTQELPIERARQGEPALTDAQVLQLARLGRRIEAHFGSPQDVEWCLVDDEIHVVQSRPITTLFPIPVIDDEEVHVFISVGQQQMMTDAMKPLGLSFWQMTTPRLMHIAGGRLFVDVAATLASPTRRAGLLDVMGRAAPLIDDALQTLVDRGDLISTLDEEGGPAPSAGAAPADDELGPAIVDELIQRSKDSIAALKSQIRKLSGSALLEFILADLQELKRILFDPQSSQVIRAGMEATWWLNDRLEEWLGEKNTVDTLTQSVDNNITSEMGLALLEVADVLRPYPDVVDFLRHAEGENFLDELPALDGGADVRDAIQAFLARYGMRCVGEIDITRPRWSERPLTLVPVILGNVKNFEPGEGERRFEQGREAAQKKRLEVLEQLRALPDGERKAQETGEVIDRMRALTGFREYPKYGMISRYFVYKLALLGEAGRLVQAGVLDDREDIFYLTFQELSDVVRSGHADLQLIAERKEQFRSYETLTAPRVFTSDGEVVAGSYRRVDVPTGALVGQPVSTGTVEGRARVISDIAEADLEPGDILVTAYTDPSWTALFVAIAGLVTEVGGLMTHGAVIAREYGLPAVVGVDNATRLIADRQRIRLNGTDGYVEILP